MHTTDTLDLLDEGMAWTTARIAAVPADALDTSTPCLANTKPTPCKKPSTPSMSYLTAFT